jgi:alkylated DNA repair protein alkB family protein 6
VACLPRSLLVFTGDAYSGCLHGIDALETEHIDASIVNGEGVGLQPGDELLRGGERISLTVRRVLKVKKNLLQL